MSENAIKYPFGDKIRAVREKKKLTLKEVAVKAGVSESLISQIERNKVSPAIDTLLDIAAVLELDLEYLFYDLKKTKKVNLVSLGDRNKIVLDKITYFKLSKTIEENEKHGIEAYEMRIAPGGKSGSNEYGHEGKELGVIIKGNAEFSIGNEKYSLSEGDSISFESSLPHKLENTGSGELVAFWVITPPKNFMKEI
jgi:transcriptional regulator with XRE-family HTH domain